MIKINLQPSIFCLIALVSVNTFSSDLLDLPLEKLVNITVTGPTLIEESIRKTPAAITVFDQHQIELMGVDSIQDLMQLVPGFQSYRTNRVSHSYSYSSRGRRIGFPSAEVLILLDGHRLEEPGNGGGANIFGQYPLANVERIEFIRGPGSVIYGSNAMMGVINIVTRHDAAYVRVQAGENEYKGVQYSNHDSNDDVHWAMHVNAEDDNGDSFDLPAAVPGEENTRDPNRLVNVDGWLQFKNLELDIHYYQTKAQEFVSEFGYADDSLYEEGEYISLRAKHTHHWQRWIQSSSLYVSQVEQMGLYVQLPQDALLGISQPASSDPLFISGTTEPENEYRLESILKRHFDNDSTLLLGLEYRNFVIDNADLISNYNLDQLLSGTTPVDSYPTIESRTGFQDSYNQHIYSAFGQFQKHTAIGSLTLGVRYDKYQEIGSEVSPRVSWVWDANDNNTLKFLYGRAFRAPAGNELQVGNFPLLSGNPDLRPETVDTFDLIWMYGVERYHLTLGYFENHFNDSIVTVATGSGSQLSYQNIKQDPAKGFELELKSELINNLLLSMSASYFTDLPDTSYTEATKLASAAINYAVSNFNFNLVFSYNGERQYRDQNQELVQLDDYWLALAKITYRFNDQISSYLSIDNLLDKKFGTPPVNSSLDQGVPNRGREAFLGMTMSF